MDALEQATMGPPQDQWHGYPQVTMERVGVDEDGQALVRVELPSTGWRFGHDRFRVHELRKALDRLDPPPLPTAAELRAQLAQIQRGER